MARVQFTGQGSVKFITGADGVADVSAPTASELAAGVDITKFLTRDGLKTPNTGNTIDLSDASSLFNKTGRGSHGGDAAELTCYRDSASDTDDAWTTFVEGTIGFLVPARFGWAQDATTGLGTADGDPTAADRCEVYPVTVISRAVADTADNEATKFVVTLAITDEPALSAVVAT
ncbi:MAG: hypothetical protein ACRDP4_13740 [Nocardioidaceae bacterium]